MLEGENDIIINGAILEKVRIKAGHAAHIIMGALLSTAKYQNQLEIHDAKGWPGCLAGYSR